MDIKVFFSFGLNSGLSWVPFEPICAHTDSVILTEPFHLLIASWSGVWAFNPKYHCPFLTGTLLFSEMQFLPVLKT